MKRIIFRGIWLIVIVLVCGGAWLGWRAMTGYVDIGHRCVIDISGSIAGTSDDEIRSILKKIKSNDPAGYVLVCEQIDHIRQAHCPVFDETLSVNTMQWSSTGCYLRGSHMVYLPPQHSSIGVSAQSLAAALVYYAGESRDFWQGVSK